MNKKILVFICCVVLVSKTIKSQVVSVEGVWHADTVQYAAPFSLGFWFINTGNAPIIDSVIIANIAITPVNAAPQNWQILTFIQSIPQGVFAPGVPIGKVLINDKQIEVLLFSDLDQITFVNVDLADVEAR